MVPVTQNSSRSSREQYRIVTAPGLPLPPNHVLVYCLCPCGAHRTHFTVHRTVLLNHMARNQSITQFLRTQSRIQRMIDVEARPQRHENHKERHEEVGVGGDEEEDIDR